MNFIIMVILYHSIFLQERTIDSYISKEFKFDNLVMPYKFLKPYKKTRKDVPLIVFLHGIGERGKDNDSQLVHGGNFFLNITEKKQFNSFVIFPQCDIKFTWSSDNPNEISTYGEIVINLIENLINNYNIDKNRIYLVGLSMGGYGTFDLISKKPNLFAAAVPICGGANLNILQNSINIPHWIFHGELDRVVPVQESRRAFNFLNERNSIHKYTEYKNTYHNSWDNVFDDSEFMNWLFSFSK